jgi:hypothetical protein
LLVLSVLVAAPAPAKDSPGPVSNGSPPERAAPPQDAADFDAIQVPSAGRPLVVTRPTAIPRQLRIAIERARCNATESLMLKHPVLIFRPADGRRVMAIAPCFGITPDSRAFLFERSVEQVPSPMTFPVIALTGGITATERPGLMTWEPHITTLTAWRGGDTCPARELRHVYRQGGGDLNGFALSRIEHRQLRCTTPEANWQTLWQSPAWKLQP